MSAFLTALGSWAANFLVSTIGPLIEKWWASHEASVAVASNTAQLNALIQSVSTLQTAKSPADFINDIQAVASADNSNSK